MFRFSLKHPRLFQRLAFTLLLGLVVSSCVLSRADFSPSRLNPFRIESIKSPPSLQTQVLAKTPEEHWKALGVDALPALSEDEERQIRLEMFAWVPTELKTLMQTALAQNQTLAIAQERLKQAVSLRRIQLAKELPELNLEPAITRQKYSQNQFIFGTNFGTLPVFNTYNLPLTASYEVDLWQINRDNTKVFNIAIKHQALQLERLKEALIAEVASNYISLLEAKRLKALQEKRLEVLHQDSFRQRTMLEQGFVDVQSLQSRQGLIFAANADLAFLNARVALFENMLHTLGGNAPTVAEPFNFQRNLMEIFPPLQVDAGLPSELIQSRPDIQAAQAFLRQKDLEVSVAKRMILPRIKLESSIGFIAVHLKDWLNWESLAYSVATSLVQPVFRGGSIKAGLKLKQSEALEALQIYHQTVVSALSDVENALVIRQASKQQAQDLATAVHVLQHKWQLEQTKIAVGYVHPSETLGTQVEALNAEIALTQIRAKQLIDEISLLKALGTGRYLL
jgi:multidrug efflux system outer membrane protein